jgi:superfamily II DNA/RNA helicase
LPNPNRKPSGKGRRPHRGGPPGRPRRPSGPPVDPLVPQQDPPEIESFQEFDLDEQVQEVIAGMGITVPTPIQALGIGPTIEGRDIIAKAETGTGKTLVFGAPMMSRIDPNRASVLGLVLCPTRELAQQVGAVLEELGKPRGLSVVLIVGGDPAGPQVAALQAGAQVVVGTPGRVIDLYDQGFLSFPWTEFVVLDEADEMLEIGFIDDVKKILRYTPDERQTMLFSATFPDALLRLAREHTSNPAELATASGIKTVDAIRQEFIPLDVGERALTLIRLLEQSDPNDVFLVFCERRTEVEQLIRRLERLPLPIKALHGGYDQAARFRVMSAFRTGEVKALIATDVASRGLDVQHVTCVINYSVPRSVTDYTHRIGRTGRAGREGRATTLVSHEHMHRWKMLLRDAPWEIERVDPPTGRARYDRGRRPGRRGAGRDTRHDEEPRRRRQRQEEREEPRREERPRRPYDEPVSLPSNRKRRQRDPGDPPPRVKLPDSEERSEEPRRRGTRQEQSEPRRERGGRSRRDRDSEPERPRRKRSGRRTDRGERKPSRSSEEGEPKREQRRSPRRSSGDSGSGGSGFGTGVES